MTTRLGLPLAAFIVCAAATACGTGSSAPADRAVGALAPAPTTAPPPTTTTSEVAPCNEVASYPPLVPLPAADSLTADSVMRDVVARHRLVVAVDENTQGLAARDASSGDLVGLEIDMAQDLARQIFGSDGHVQFKTVTTKQKIAYPAEGEVDLAISAISMTCERWQQVAFSSEYYRAHHAFLVRKDSPVGQRNDVAGKRVCMTKGSTSIGVLERMNETLRPKAVPQLVDARTDCLVALQEGETDAYLGHDTFLVGMVEQDPNMRIVEQGEEQHYGIAMSPHATAFVQYVNGFLEQERSSGRLQALYDLRLGPLATLAQQRRPVVPPADATRPLP